MIDEVRMLPAELIDEVRYRDVIAARVYPAPTGVEAAFVEQAQGRGQFYVFVPPQAEDRKPFLVRGAPFGGRVLAQSITIPWRDGDRTRYDDIGAVHAALRASRLQAAGDAELERVWLEGMPPLFRAAVELARRAGLLVDVVHQGFSVQLPDGSRVDLSASNVVPGEEPLVMHGAMRRLAEYGVPVRATSGASSSQTAPREASRAFDAYCDRYGQKPVATPARSA